MEKIRVAFFAEILIADFDGASRTMFQLFERIDHDRFEFLFICGTGPEQVAGFECLHLPTIQIPLNSKYKIALPALGTKTIQARLDAFAPDVIHIATPSPMGHFALDYASRKEIPVVTIYHTHFISYIHYYLKYLPFLISPVEKLAQNIQNRFYDGCQKVYVPSSSMVSELGKMGMDAGKMKIWKRGIDGALFSPTKKNPDYLRQLTGNDLPTVFFASRLVWEKNLETLIEIHHLLQEENVSCNFLIAGDGVASKECRQRMSDAIFLGEVDHETLSVLYASATVFVFTSVSETFGNVVLEAMASGLVPVVADGGGSRDFITNGENGYKCEPNDAAEYVGRIKKLIESRLLRHSLSKNAIEHSRAYDWDELANIYFNDLAELASPVEATIQA
ncbi:glycosyltransferase family 4 protein [Dyadobacter luticola]|uniref:Glycosyltransferase family 1 protein n=1 Tax=Dyadobacter luticola TaxID=1979387 RepID=A0A5R9L4P3_9BACT|nr:glycosyltransferase family 1 protein [Dyadobacter luticola]TLV03337.1 glycosyltransferase family 1 protein [Dyadobacter luticola]